MSHWLLHCHCHHLDRAQTGLCHINEAACHWAPWAAPYCLINDSTNILCGSVISNYFFLHDIYCLKLEVFIFRYQHSIKRMFPGSCQGIARMWCMYKTYRKIPFLGSLNLLFVLNKICTYRNAMPLLFHAVPFIKEKIPKPTPWLTVFNNYHWARGTRTFWEVLISTAKGLG